MNWALQKLVALAAIISLSACASTTDRLGSVSRVDPHTIAAYHADQDRFYHNDTTTCPMVRPYNDFNFGAVDLDCFRFPEATKDGAPGNGKTAYELAITSPNARNRLVAILIKQSDNVCTLEMGRFTSRSALVGTGFGIATTALAGAATIVTGQTAKSILAGVATVVSGSREQINSEIYQHQVATAIGHAIINERQRRYTEIKSHFEDTPEKWPVDLAILEVDSYHQQCSFYRGLDLVLSSVDANKGAKTDIGTSEPPADPVATLITQYKADASTTTKAIDEENKKALGDRDQKKLIGLKANFARDNEFITSLAGMLKAAPTK